MLTDLTPGELSYLIFIIKNDIETLGDSEWIDDGDRYTSTKLLHKLEATKSKEEL